MLYSIGKFASEIGVSQQTLRNWHKSGTLVPDKVTLGGTRFYSNNQLLQYLGKYKQPDKKNYIYARVSSNNQKDDLENQLDFLKTYANAKGIITEELKDIGSGLNYNRKNWNKLLELVQKGQVEKIIIAHKDRFIRFGYDWFEKFCNLNGCNIIVVNNEKLSPQEELVQDLISIIHVFSCRIYGLRKYKSKIDKDEDL